MAAPKIKGSMDQLNEWLKGNSIHYKAGCVPDLSCCVSGIETPFHEKERFVKAVKNNEVEVVREMMNTFLVRFKDVHGDFLESNGYNA